MDRRSVADNAFGEGFCDSGSSRTLIGTVWLLAFVALLAIPNLNAHAGAFCGTDCVISEDFDDATPGNGSTTNGTFPAGWVQETGEGGTDTCGGNTACQNWYVFTGQTPSAAATNNVDIGPRTDHTDGLGNYIYVEASGNNNANVNVRTPAFTLPAGGAPYATFFVFSNDTDAGSGGGHTLNVDVMNAAGTAVLGDNVLTISDTTIAHWRPAYVDLAAFSGSTVRLRFQWQSSVPQPSTTSNFNHDIAIDDFAVVADRNSTPGTGRTVNQTYILPSRANDILTFLDVVNGTAEDPIETYTAISVAADGAIIYYDEQEDPYEGDITNPSQTFGSTTNGPAPISTSTQIWGDGYPENGYPPGHPEDLLNLGEVIILREPTVDTTTLDSILDFDAGDIFASTVEIAVTRAFWATGDETLNAGAIELFPTSRWGTNYTIPIGHDMDPGDVAGTQSCNTNASGDNPFQEVALFITSNSDDNQVTVNFNNGGGTTDFQQDVDRGESVFVGFNSTVNVGATVTAEQDVQVHAFTADEDTNFGSRFYTLVPRNQWTDTYFAPFDSSVRGSGALMIYNPNGQAVDVDIYNGSNPPSATPELDVNNQTIAAGGFFSYELPVTTALNGTTGGRATRVESTGGEDIYVVAVMDSCDRDHDWGGALLPNDTLTSAMLIPLGFGSDPTSSLTGNHSPVWATPTESTFIYVDFNGDFQPDLVDLNGDGDTNDTIDGISEATSDQGMSVGALQLLRIHDLDNDQSGTLVFSLTTGGAIVNADYTGRIAGATIAGGWGQDSFGDTPVGSPAIDVGTAFAPITFPESLPVTLSWFRATSGFRGLDFRWGTASETFTVGFNLWGQVDGEWRQLNDRLIFNYVTDSLTPQRYRESVRVPRRDNLTAVGISSVDTDGSEHFYGPFRLGDFYGSEATPDPIPWDAIRAEMDQRLRDKGYVKVRGVWRKPRSRAARRALRLRSAFYPVSLETTEVGMHRLTYQQLVAEGIDLRGVPLSEIAITHKGRPVPRLVDGSRGRRFGPGGFIDFYARAVDEEDARYTGANVYQLRVDGGLALESGEVLRNPDPRDAPEYYIETVERDHNVLYAINMPVSEPWYEHRMLGLHGVVTGQASVDLSLDNLVSDAVDDRIKIRLGLAGISFFDGSAPDHHALVYLNGAAGPVADVTNDGIVDWQVEIPLAAGSLQPGDNTIRVEVPGVEGYQFDLVYGDTYAIDYPRAFVAVDDKLSFTEEAASFSVSGLGNRDIVAYAVDDNDNLASLLVRLSRQRGQVSAHFPGIAKGSATYWVSTVDAMHSPDIVGIQEPVDLTDPGADYVIVAHPAFIDRLTENTDFLNAKSSQGFSTKVVDVHDIYMHYGYGLPVPGAIHAYLKAQDEVQEIKHVLIVGGATSDPHGYSGSNSVDFVPTLFAKTGEIVHHSPSDGLLVDLFGRDGAGSEPDGVPDRSIGRWPVRTLAELDTIIAKTLQYQQTMAGQRSVMLVADATDARFPPFSSQTEAIGAKLATPGTPPQPWTDVTRVFVDDYPSVAAARNALKQGFNDGQTMTIYSGHASPIGWTFQGLLDWQAAQSLQNDGQPTLVGTLSCYTSYYVSPSTDTIGHQLLLAGDQGAAVIQGAATLTSFSQNQEMLGRITDAMVGGQTVGEGVLAARKALGASYKGVIVNWSLLGDPSIYIEP